MLSIIIVHYDTAEELRDCLVSLQQIPDFVEVVVVDNGSPTSPDRARQLVEDHQQMRWVESEENLGFGGATHIGIGKASGDSFLILNPDSKVLDANWSELENELRGDRILCADLVSPSGRSELPGWFEPSFASEILRTFVQGRIDRGRDWPARLLRRQGLHTDRLAWVTGAALGISRSVWNALGGFDPAFFLFFEDIDLCLRHRRGGGRCGVSQHLRVMHTRGVASKRHSAFAESHYRKSQEIFWERHGGWWSRRWMKLVNRIQRRRTHIRFHWRRRR